MSPRPDDRRSHRPGSRPDSAPGAGPRPRSALMLLAFLGATALAAGIGGIAASGAQETYAALRLPVFAPPAWLFGPAWTVLYVLIAVAGWLVWRRTGWDRAIALWCGQLVLNAVWTPLFFGADLYWLAFAEIALLWIAILACLAAFRSRRPMAAGLLVPYLAWVTYAGALNLGIALLN